MASSPNVVRSLSADELASSLQRTDRQLFPSADPAAPAPPPDHKHKTGLLKRLRRVLRISAQSTRSSNYDKRARQPSSSPARLDDSYASFVPTNPHLPHKPASRSRTWRGPLHSSRTPQEGPIRDIDDSNHGSRSSIGKGLGRSRAPVTDPDLLSSDKGAPGSSSGPNTSARNLHRSLPKRVFSSPPSLSARTFGFGRKKSSTGKSHARSDSVSSGFGEGDLNGIKRLNRSLVARNSLYESRGSMNLASISPNINTPSSPERSAAAFREVVEAAVSGRIPFSRLLDAMYRLEERLMADTKDMLIKYLSRQENMEALIDRLTVIAPVGPNDTTDEGPLAQRERYRYSYVSCTLLSTGPIQLLKSLFLNPRHLDRLVHVLGHGTPTDPVVVRSVCKVLLSVLRYSPQDTVRAMGKRKDFIDALLSHIAVTGCPEVCLNMLSTVRCQSELKFEPCNKPVVGMMADAKLMETLCNKLAAAAEKGPLDGISSSTIENCSRVIVGIALRVLVIPKYEIDHDDPDAGFMMKFNRDLASLDVFSEPRPIFRLLDSGFIAINSYDTRGYALSTAITAVRYLLVTALKGQDSSLSTIRMQLMTVNTAAYEAGVRARIPKMAKVLDSARNGAVVDTMWEKVENPLGIIRLKILELIIVLLQHGTESTAMAIAKADVPRILIDLFVRLKHNSLLQHFVSAIIELVFTGRFPYLRRAFLIDLKILDSMMTIWEGSSVNGKYTKRWSSNYTGELLRIVCSIHDFFKIDTPEARDYRQELSPQTLQDFDRFCKGPVAEKLKENGSLLCDAGELPLRHADDLGINGYGSIGGSQGSLFLRAREANGVLST